MRLKHLLGLFLFIVIGYGLALTPLSTGSKPVYSTVYGNKLYVENFQDNTVSVIDTTKNTTKTLTVGSGPLSAAVLDKHLYVNNSQDNTISVVDMSQDKVTSTIKVPKGALYSFFIDKNLYVLGGSDISIIDAGNKITKVLSTGDTSVSQYFTISPDKKVYIYHPDETNITILDAKTNTLNNIRGVGMGIVSGLMVGKNLYILNAKTGQIFCIDLVKGALLEVNQKSFIPTGRDPANMVLVGNKIYVANTTDNTLTIIDAAKCTVLKTLPVGTRPNGLLSRQGTLLVLNTGDKTVSLVNTKTDTITQTLATDSYPYYGVSLGKKVFILNQESHSVSSVNFDIPALVSFNTNKESGTYGEGVSIIIRANFDKTISRLSKMELILSNNKTVKLTYRTTKTLSGVYIIHQGDDVALLTVKSIKTAEVKSPADASGLEYTIPKGKNLGDDKKIVVQTTKK